MIDCGDGVAAAWLRAGLPAPLGVALSGGPEQEAGLFAFLLALGRTDGQMRDGLTLLHDFQRDTPVALVGAWMSSGAPTFPVAVEANFPPVKEALGPFVAAWSRRVGDTLIWRIRVAGRELVFLGTIPVTRWVGALARGVDFAIVPAGITPPAGIAGWSAGGLFS